MPKLGRHVVPCFPILRKSVVGLSLRQENSFRGIVLMKDRSSIETRVEYEERVLPHQLQDVRKSATGERYQIDRRRHDIM
jgi:hypothetical protein